MDKPDTPTLFITNKAREGYRRAGMAFAKGDNAVSANLFTEDQLAALQADPRLVVKAAPNAAAETSETQGPVDDGGVGAGVTDSGVVLKDKPEEVQEELPDGLARLRELHGSGELELNSSGKPNADVLGVNAKQRDEVWAIFCAEQEQDAE
ncbi:HI1506-related protein [Endozoicomonas numazuensis]|uniref:HI1506-related protein n=1 Tax=Endozoicomonas numazuensis TaxID=1137799 RepID=UPI000558A516|nr:HI1506-related protein [Endozoicomonas numazuensis]